MMSFHFSFLGTGGYDVEFPSHDDHPHISRLCSDSVDRLLQ